MNYKEQLLDPRWQKKRLQVYENNDFTCQFCGDKNKTLNVHHFCYVKGGKAWDSPMEDLITICKDCHKINHSAKYLTKEENELIGFITSMVQINEGKNEGYNFLAQQANKIILAKLKRLGNG